MDSVLILISNTERLSQIKELRQEEFFLLFDCSTEEIHRSSSNGQRKRCGKYTLAVRL